MDPKLAAQIVMVFGAVIGLLCLYGLVFPKQLIGWVTDFWKNKASFIIAILIRLFLGVTLIFAASATQYESIFKLLGYIMIVAAVVIAALGKAKISIMILWVKTWPLLWVRAWLLFGLLFAGLLIVGTR
ncbi:hypothetical protein F7C95_14510 [Opitutia bacterium ISCC 51]|nr:hypothetical protein F7C95_14510 [Opitutae bacterium ISCC 51]QXD27210.1 hypothetical protein GA003_14425 [Opitutae bacterium ISCC 52]